MNDPARTRTHHVSRQGTRLGATRRVARTLGLAVILSLAVLQPAFAQSSDDLKVTIYPVFAWLPTGIDIDVELPPFDGGAGGRARIVDSRFDGAFLGGLSLAKGLWRVDGDGMWAGVGGDRPPSPALTVDADGVYLHATGGIKFLPDLYATAGVRRVAVKYDVKLADQPDFRRKPSITDPIIGIGYHRVRRVLEVHGVFEGGGFGVGSESEFSGSFRLDVKPVAHFGITAGYSFLYFNIENTVQNRTFKVRQTLQGPIIGIGLYF